MSVNQFYIFYFIFFVCFHQSSHDNHNLWKPRMKALRGCHRKQSIVCHVPPYNRSIIHDCNRVTIVHRLLREAFYGIIFPSIPYRQHCELKYWPSTSVFLFILFFFSGYGVVDKHHSHTTYLITIAFLTIKRSISRFLCTSSIIQLVAELVNFWSASPEDFRYSLIALKKKTATYASSILFEHLTETSLAWSTLYVEIK